MKNYERELIVAREAAMKARAILLRHFGNLKQVEIKEQAGLVSEADRSAELAIKTHLVDSMPEYGFLGEEESYLSSSMDINKKLKGTWVVDPLDGTTNYVHQLPLFCISIGLVVDQKPVVGVIDVPILNNTYWAARGSGAFINGQRLQVSQTTQLSQCLASTGLNAERKDTISYQLSLFSEIVKNVRGVRRTGSAAYDLTLVASGIFDFFWEQHLSPWDVAAGQILVEEAGGQLSTYLGEDYNPWEKTILASNAKVHSDIVKILSEGKT